MIDLLASRGYFLVAFVLMGIGTYVLIGSENLIKKVIGMNVFQTGIFLFFIASAFVTGASPPLLSAPAPYVSPLPHVLILTAIVVGVSLTAVALGLIVRIYDEYGSLRESEIREVAADE
ncbi:cation:proton antiporter subunit C [Halolamina sp. CBA1230]|uniref:cation:proton antiporter subunit C n=1 Tax=Halolamina sp. CBA1230 TaxID=1853690 RepID=UPI0009A153E6|nr:cation:proton antiporter subunit C [Halolamina sp. CBA1230]QKY20314.1 cation:proton antiporter subunit C [Halolamina sp. CBA1230]